ncbi:MAG: BlaI/MecI/CopY family transcriptional regulator, partial [Gemmatimonadaceae bacterium]|nr:BlaI/MecI/CopY family transcriptional regulator [Gemmatimonadaceae bacterium]
MMRIAFTERELDVMAVLWEHGPSTAGEVREQLTDDLAYNTVLSMLRILEEKGYVSHTEEGRAHRYFPLVERGEAGSSAIDRLVEKV